MKGVKLSILFVDDERIICESVKDYFEDLRLDAFSDPEVALGALRRDGYDIVCVDYRMPKMSGLDLLMEAKKTDSYRYGILLTAYADTQLLEQFINHSLIRKALEKPIDLELLRAVFEEAAADCESERRREALTLEREQFLQTMLGRDEAVHLPRRVLGLSSGLRGVFEQARRFAASEENVLITGETGTGKEVMARLIHTMSSRAGNPFVKINCGSLPETLIESELFGYAKGAFSGAIHDKPGRIELANSGTLFLDEVAELKPDLQTRLLSVVQDKTVERLGGTSERPVDFRLVAATNRDLPQAMHDGLFREDLFFRISTLPITIPPLREYRDDIEEFVASLLSNGAEELNRRPLTITASALDYLKSYAWPGNIRELENVITRAMILLDSSSDTIDVDDLAFLSAAQKTNGTSMSSVIEPMVDLLVEHTHSLDELEQGILQAALDRYAGDVMETVRRTGIAKDRLYRLKNS